MLRNLDLTVRRGEAVGIAGPSGAGKSTLLKIMLGLMAPSSGVVRLFGAAPGFSRRQAVIGYSPDDHGLPPGLTGAEALGLHAHLVRGRRPGVQDKVEASRRVDVLRLGPALGRRIATYSLGMRSRLAFLLAMTGDPELVILDDPLTGIDPELRCVMRDELTGFVERGGTLVVSTHLLLDLEGTVSRIAILSEGRLVADAPSERVYPAAEAWYRSAIGPTVVTRP